MMILDTLLKHGMWKLLLVTSTIVGAFGGFPTPPKAFLNLASYQVVQWGLVFVLAYQGGAGEDPMLAAMATAITFVLYKAVKALENNDDELL
jgi:hypothetical protein